MSKSTVTFRGERENPLLYTHPFRTAEKRYQEHPLSPLKLTARERAQKELHSV